MGLKKSNFEITQLGITLPEAYAMVKDIEIHGEQAVAKIAVQQSRDFAVNKKPIVEATIRFKVNRNENPYETVYKIAKGTRKQLVKNAETQKPEIVEVPMPFHDWEDDIVTTD